MKVPEEQSLADLEKTDWTDIPDDVCEEMADRYATRVTCPECDDQFWSHTMASTPNQIDCPGCSTELLLLG